MHFYTENLDKDNEMNRYLRKQASDLIRSFKETESWSVQNKKLYYGLLRNECLRRKQKPTGCSWLIAKLAPLLRNFPIEIRGTENIPEDTTVVFVGNHSNSHDFFIIKEVFSRIKRAVTPLAAWDGLSLISRTAFYLGNVTFIERSNKDSIENGILKFCSKILNGNDGFILGEATWNLHPFLPMQKVKAGVVQTSLITGKPIIPVIIEYVEVPKFCKKEKELYSRCVVKFGKPIFTMIEDNIFAQAENVQKIMELMRRELWIEFGIIRDNFGDLDKEIYLNHLYLKKFMAFGFKYDSEQESKFLLNKENEFIVDSMENFVPGILRE